MVYKKYTFKNGRKYGPYYYENKRVGDKVITTYLGSEPPKQGVGEIGRKESIVIILAMLILVGYIFIIAGHETGFFNNSMTGFSISENPNAEPVIDLIREQGTLPGDEKTEEIIKEEVQPTEQQNEVIETPGIVPEKPIVESPVENNANEEVDENIAKIERVPSETQDAGTDCYYNMNPPEYIGTGQACSMASPGDNTCIDMDSDNTMESTDDCHMSSECSAHVGASCNSYSYMPWPPYSLEVQSICVVDMGMGSCSSTGTVSGEYGNPSGGIRGGTAANFHSGNENGMCSAGTNDLSLCSTMSSYNPSASGVCVYGGYGLTCDTMGTSDAYINCVNQSCEVSDLTGSFHSGSCTSTESGWACDSAVSSAGFVQDGICAGMSSMCVTSGHVCNDSTDMMPYLYGSSGMSGCGWNPSGCNDGDPCDATLTDGNFDPTYGTCSGTSCVAASEGGGEDPCNTPYPTSGLNCSGKTITYTSNAVFNVSLNYTSSTISAQSITVQGGATVVYDNVTLKTNSFVVQSGAKVEFRNGKKTIWHNGDFNISGEVISNRETHRINGSGMSMNYPQINVLNGGNWTVLNGTNITYGSDTTAFYIFDVYGNLTLIDSDVGGLKGSGLRIKAGAGDVRIGNVTFSLFETSTTPTAITSSSNFSIIGNIKSDYGGIVLRDNNNLLLNCYGNSINYSIFGLGYGLNITGINKTVINGCSFREVIGSAMNSRGLFLYYANNTNITHSSFITNSSSAYGLYIESSHQSNFTNVSVETKATSAYGVYYFTSNKNSFYDGKIVTQQGSYGAYLSAVSGNKIINSNISAFGSSSAIYAATSGSNVFSNNSITATGGDAIFVYGNSDDNVFDNNTIVYALDDGMQVGWDTVGYPARTNISRNKFLNSAGFDLNVLSDESNAGTWLISQPINKYSLSGCYLTLMDLDYGFVKFDSMSSFVDNGPNLSRQMWIGNNSVFVNGTENFNLNKTANVTFYGIGSRFSSPILKRNGVQCNASLCYNFTSLSADTVVFNVSGWSNYTIGAAPVNNPPFLNFTAPTPNNATSITNSSVVINATIDDEGDTNTVIWNWNATNYTMYNNSLLLMLNFDNRSELGENSTKFVDMSKYGNNGSFKASSEPKINYTIAKYGASLQFDGADDYANLSASATLNLSIPFTISIWAYFNNATRDGSIFKKGGQTNNDEGDNNHENYALFVNTSARITARFGTGAAVVDVGSTSSFSAGRWYNIIYMVNTTSAILYLDGVQNNLVVHSSSAYKNNQWLVLGASYWKGTNYGTLDGNLDSLRIWNRTLSAGEIEQLYMTNLRRVNTTQWEFYANESLGTEGLTNRVNTFQLFARDNAGNENSTEQRTVTRLAVAPSFSFTAPTPDNATTTANSSIVINATIDDEGDMNTIKFNWNATNYTIYNNSLRVMYNFDDYALMNDTSIYGNNATCTNCPSKNYGKYGGAYYFDGINDELTLPALPKQSTFTISLWFKLNKTRTASDSNTLQFYAGAGTDPDNYLYLSASDGKITYRTWLPTDNLLTTTNSWTAQEWYHVAIGYNGTAKIIYVNGVQENSVNVASISLNTGSVHVLGSGSGSAYFNGTIDEFRIWNYSLSAGEIQQLYASNLRKLNATQWEFYANESLGNEGGTSRANTYQLFARDNVGNENSTEQRTVTRLAVAPSLNFTAPTLNNATSTINNSAKINATIDDESDLNTVIFNWNATNYTIYNNSLVFMLNFDNRSELEENSTRVVDVSKYGNNGTCSGTSCPTFDSGKYGNAFSFDGGSDYYTIPHNPSLMFISSFAISTWIYPKKIPMAATATVIEKYDGGSSLNYGIQFDGTGSWPAIGFFSGSWIWASVTSALQANTWYNIVGVFDDSADTLSIYVNGVLNATTSTGASPVANTASAVTIGLQCTAGGCAGRYFNGTIDEIRMWNRSLSVGEVQQLYVTNLQKFNSTHWEFYANESLGNEGLGSRANTYQLFARDNAGNENSTEQRTVTRLAVPPLSTLVSPTPENGTGTYNDSVKINATIDDESDLNTFIFNWNATNYTMYNNSLRVMYNFDDYALINDSSRYGSNATCTSCPDKIAGRYGGAYLFNGIDDYLTVPTITKQFIFTVSLWFSPNVSWASGAPASQQLYTAGGTDPDNYLYLNTDGTLIYRTWLPTDNLASTTNSWTKNQWYHVAISYNGTDKIIYVNGVRENSVNIGGISLNSGDCHNIGRYCSAGYFNGTIDEFRIWNYSLSAGEIQQLYMSNLRKLNATQWEFYANESLGSALSTSKMNTYQLFARDNMGNENLTEKRTIFKYGIPPSLNFTAPTPVNGTSTTNTSIKINATIDDNGDLSRVIWNWNATNYTIYNGDSLLMLNFENKSALGENSTEVRDVSSNALVGRVFGALFKQSAGKYGGAYAFDGIDDYINITSDSSLNNAKISVGFWLMPNATLNGGSSYVSFVNHPNYELFYQAGSVVFSYLGSNLSLVKTLSSGVWYHIYGAYDGTNRILYINGAESNNSAITNFGVKNSAGGNIASFSSLGYITISGKCTIESSCATPADGAFIVNNATGNTVAFVNSTGDMCLSKGDCAGRHSDCNSYGDSSFLVKNAGGDVVSFINATGELCLMGDLIQNGSPAS